jgi:protein TonB
VRYLAEPRMSVPLLSRRLKESGTVVLRIVVDVRGMLKEAVVSKSSGFPRLDEQALQDIRTARFAPQTENGQPIEWQTLAPLAYEVN